MKLRIKKNLLANTWDEAVYYRKWELEAIEVGGFEEATKWGQRFTETLERLEAIVTDSYCTMHDMATIEAKALIKEYKEQVEFLQSLKDGAA